MQTEQNIYMKFNVRKIISYNEFTKEIGYGPYFTVFAVVYNSSDDSYLSLVNMSNSDRYCLASFNIDDQSSLYNLRQWEYELIYTLENQGYDAHRYI